MVAYASSGKSRTFSYFPRISQMTTTSKASVSFLGRHFTLRSEGLFMAWLFSPKQQQHRKVLKRSDPLFIREITHGASM